jgi:hypothetical protein
MRTGLSRFDDATDNSYNERRANNLQVFESHTKYKESRLMDLDPTLTPKIHLSPEQ